MRHMESRLLLLGSCLIATFAFPNAYDQRSVHCSERFLHFLTK